MICPLLTYADMQKAMAELAEVFELRIVWLGDGAAEIRWNGGVAVAQTDQPEVLHGSHVGNGWTYVRVSDPDAHYSATFNRGGHVLNKPHSSPMARSADTAPAIERATSGPSDPTSSAADAGVSHRLDVPIFVLSRGKSPRRRVTPASRAAAGSAGQADWRAAASVR